MKNSLEFFQNRLIGLISKSIVEEVFVRSGYHAFPFGYESTFSVVAHESKKNKDETSMRIRTSPDILIHNPENTCSALIEVKYSSHNKINSIIIQKYLLDNYRKSWNDAYLVYVVLDDIGIYAQKISEIKVNAGKSYILKKRQVYYLDLKKNFKPLRYFFPEIKKEVIDSLKPTIRSIKNIKCELN